MHVFTSSPHKMTPQHFWRTRRFALLCHSIPIKMEKCRKSRTFSDLLRTSLQILEDSFVSFSRLAFEWKKSFPFQSVSHRRWSIKRAPPPTLPPTAHCVRLLHSSCAAAPRHCVGGDPVHSHSHDDGVTVPGHEPLPPHISTVAS